MSRMKERASLLNSNIEQLHKEIESAQLYMKKILDNSRLLSTHLDRITSTQTFLKVFSRGHGIVLKYMNLLTDINCKFELTLSELEEELEVFTNPDISLPSRPNSVLDNIEEKCHSFVAKSDGSSLRDHQNNDNDICVNKQTYLPLFEFNLPQSTSVPATEPLPSFSQLTIEDPFLSNINLDSLISQMEGKNSSHSIKWSDAEPFIPKNSTFAHYLKTSFFPPPFVPSAMNSCEPAVSILTSEYSCIPPPNIQNTLHPLHNLPPPPLESVVAPLSLLPSNDTCITSNASSSVTSQSQNINSFQGNKYFVPIATKKESEAITPTVSCTTETGASKSKLLFDIDDTASLNSLLPEFRDSTTVPSIVTRKVSKLTNGFPSTSSTTDLESSGKGSIPFSKKKSSTVKRVDKSTGLTEGTGELPKKKSECSTIIDHQTGDDLSWRKHIPEISNTFFCSTSNSISDQISSSANRPMDSFCYKGETPEVLHKSGIRRSSQFSVDIPLASEIPIPILEFDRSPGKIHKVLVDHIESPSKFFVQLATQELFKIREMRDEIEKYFSNEENRCLRKYQLKTKIYSERKRIASEKLGSFAFLFVESENEWYRIEIIDWRFSDNDDNVLVTLIDYGESKMASLNDIQPLPQHFRHIARFAVECHLSGICPLDFKNNGTFGKWSNASVSTFMAFCGEVDVSIDCPEITISHHDGRHSLDSIPVILVLDGKESVNSLLVSMGHAVYIPTSDLTGLDENSILEKWNPPAEEFLDEKNCYNVNTDEPGVALEGYSGKDGVRICPFFSQTGKCFKGDSCRKEHVLEKPAFTQDKEEIQVREYNAMPPPKVGSMIKVIITTIMRINKFYCLREPSENNPGEKYYEEKLESFTHYMNSEKNIREMLPLTTLPALGELVLSRFSEDNTWYRGRVISIHDLTEKVEIFYVDYGNVETTSLKYIRKIEPRYLHLPFQAIECTIVNIESKRGVDTKLVMDHLSNIVDRGDLVIQVCSILSDTSLPGNNLSLGVLLYDKESFDIGQDLVARGLAELSNSREDNKFLSIIPG